MKQLYAMRQNGKYIKDFSDLCDSVKLTDDIDKAKLYTKRGIREMLMLLERHSVDIVTVEVQRTVSEETPVPASKMVDSVIADMQTEFDILNVQAEADIDAMEEKDFRRWRRLKRCIENRIIDEAPV